MDARAKEDVSLPKATLVKIIKEMLPREVRVSRDAQDLLMECCIEFINLISSEANEICNKEEKKTIAPEHVIQALHLLGFGSYVSEVQAAYEAHRAEAMESPRSGGRWNAAFMSEEEAIAQQQKMFAEARAKMNNNNPMPNM